MINRIQLPLWLVLGDLLALLGITVVGFATHREAIDWHILTTFLPFLAAWTAVAPWVGVYQEEWASEASQLWRPPLAAFLAAPMAAWLRGLWLSRAIAPVFVLVLGLSAALGFFIWRLAWVLIVKQTKRYG